MIFDVNMGETIGRKDRFLADRNKTQTPAEMKYSYAVLRESFQIELDIAALNDLYILKCDIQNAFLTVEFREKYGL